jgi:thioredoxin reductase
MTTPTIAPTKFSKTDADYNIAKMDKSGATRLQIGSVTVPSATGTSVVIGLVPFRKGATLVRGSTSIHIANIGDGSFTADIGYVYDDNVTYTNDPDAFAAGDILGRTGGFAVLGATAGLTWVAQADGWIAVTTGGSATDAEGAITFQVALSYDGSL